MPFGGCLNWNFFPLFLSRVLFGAKNETRDDFYDV